MNKAVFLDRDGVLIKDIGLMSDKTKIQLLEYVPETLMELKNAGFLLIVITNQAIVARGILTEEEVKELNREIAEKIVKSGGPKIDKFYFCPHHPNADLPVYRQDCECRKPNQGMLLNGAEEFNIDLKRSFMIGDRISDIIAGKKAGCHTILLETGCHKEKPIETPNEVDWNTNPDCICCNLMEAKQWIFSNTGDEE